MDGVLLSWFSSSSSSSVVGEGEGVLLFDGATNEVFIAVVGRATGRGGGDDDGDDDGIIDGLIVVVVI